MRVRIINIQFSNDSVVTVHYIRRTYYSAEKQNQNKRNDNACYVDNGVFFSFFICDNRVELNKTIDCDLESIQLD